MKKTYCLIILLINVTIIYGQKKLSGELMIRDLNILESAWTNLHPGIYRYNTPAQFAGYFQELRAKCSVDQEERTFYIWLSQLSEKIKCGHTYLNPLNLEDSISQRFLPKKIIPLFFVVSESKLIITHDMSGGNEIQRGDEILSINGIPAQRIIDSLLTVSRSDGQHALGKKLNNLNETPDEAQRYSLFDIYFPLFFPFEGDQFLVETRVYKTGGKKLRVLPVTNHKDRWINYQRRYEDIFSETVFDYKLLNPQAAYMKFKSFALWNSSFKPGPWVDSVFSLVIKNPAIKNLVIDIRNNEGGDNTGDQILSYITQQPIGCNDRDHRCYRYLNVRDSLLPYLSTWDKSFKKPKDPSLYFVNSIGLYEQKDSSACDAIKPAAYTFKGKVYLLINAKNSSATYEMARNFRDGKLGVIVGEPTGGSQQGINGGEFFFLTLPGSHFELDLPLIYNYHPNKPDAGIVPDFLVPTRQADIAAKSDPQLEFVMKRIKQGTQRTQ